MRACKGRLVASLFGVLLILACENAGQDRILGLTTTGTVDGTVYFDRNASGTPDGSDSVLGNVQVSLVARGTRDTAASGLADAQGAFTLPAVPVGAYDVVVDRSLLGDTLELAGVEPSSVVVGPDDTLAISVGVGFPRLATVSALASATLGRRVVVTGLAQNGSAAFGDSTVYLLDTSGVGEARSVRSPVAAGDSLRLLGVVADRSGRRVIIDGTAFTIVQTSPPAPLDVTTAVADSGTASGRLISVSDARITDSVTVANDLVLTLDDGSGPVTARITTASGIVRDGLAPAAVLDLTGILAPTATGWRLQPRSAADLTVQVAVATVADVRVVALGTRVVVTGVAISAWNAFGDSTLHLADATGSLRATAVASVVAAIGDSVRLTGTVATRDGQRVLNNVTAERLGTGTARTPQDVSTLTAAQAGVGLDAALVRVQDGAVSDTMRPGTDLVLTLSDGSGDLLVVMDSDAGLSTTGLVPGAVLDVTGVLVPTGTGQWRLAPRNDADVVSVVPVVTVATARVTPVGEEVVIIGVALNDRAAFGDATVHLRDATGSLRATGVATSLVFQGDSARFRGTVGTLSGQRVLQSVTVTRLSNVGAPAAATFTTTTAALASGGLQDAALVRVANAAVTARVASPPDLLLTVNDGSGALTVVLDADAGIDGTPYQSGAVLDITGVLVPTGGGQWRLKPRATTDLVVRVPVLSTNAVRSRPVGDTVVIVGVALNRPVAFGDSTFHVVDTSGALRTVLSGSPTVFIGDSVRVLGVVGIRDGQPVLVSAVPTVVTPVGAPTATAVTSQVAADAFGVRLDAALVLVGGATISAVSTNGAGDFVMTVSDGSGPVDVVLDVDGGFATGSYTIGVVVTVRGVLVPSGVIGRWVLKPRVQADITP